MSSRGASCGRHLGWGEDNWTETRHRERSTRCCHLLNYSRSIGSFYVIRPNVIKRFSLVFTWRRYCSLNCFNSRTSCHGFDDRPGGAINGIINDCLAWFRGSINDCRNKKTTAEQKLRMFNVWRSTPCAAMHCMDLVQKSLLLIRGTTKNQNWRSEVNECQIWNCQSYLLRLEWNSDNGWSSEGYSSSNLNMCTR